MRSCEEIANPRVVCWAGSTRKEVPMPWDPQQYLKFAGQRLRPALDLLSRVDLDDPAEVYDLGAGAGNVTRVIADRWPNARITGVDESEAMLEKARAAAPAITWERANLATWSPPRPADLIYSNAALHWLDGHDAVFPRLVRRARPGRRARRPDAEELLGPVAHRHHRGGADRPVARGARAAAPHAARRRAGLLLRSPQRRAPPRSTCGRASTCRCSRVSIP